MLARVFLIPLVGLFVLVSHEISSPSGLLPWFFEPAHSALNIFPSGQMHVAVLSPSACFEIFLPHIFFLSS